MRKTSALYRALIASLAVAAGAAAGCSEAPGEMLIAVQTDMDLPKDVDTVKIEVSVAGVPKFANRYDRLGDTGSLRLPATLGVVANEDDPDLPVTIRAAALSQGRARVLREVVTQVPAGRVSTLRVPLRFVCDGSADLEDDLETVLNKCPAGQTCVAGACVDSHVDEASMPDYDAADIFGGGSGQPDSAGHYGGVCVDVARCFAEAVEAAIDMSDCTIAAPEGEFNVALRGEATGMCNGTGCYVALDGGDAEGWVTNNAGRIQLPRAICDASSPFTGGVTGVVTAPAGDGCPRKTVSIPTCGPWSSAGDGAPPDTTQPTAVATGDTPLGAVRIVEGSNGTPDMLVWSVIGGYDDAAKEFLGGMVKAMPLAGGAVQTHFDGASEALSPRYLAADGERVYWTASPSSGGGGRILSAPLAGGAPEDVIPGVSFSQPEGIAVIDNAVFVTDFNAGTAAGYDLQTLQPLFSSQGEEKPLRISASDELACWVSEGTLTQSDGTVSCWVQGTSPTSILPVNAGLATPRAIAVRGRQIFWATFDQAGAVYRADWDGGAGFSFNDAIATDQAYPNGLAVDDAGVYWTTRGDGAVRRLPLDGTTSTAPETIASGQRRPGEITVTAEAIYWVIESDKEGGGGAVVRLAR